VATIVAIAVEDEPAMDGLVQLLERAVRVRVRVRVGVG
jgi:hypothetical protein